MAQAFEKYATPERIQSIISRGLDTVMDVGGDILKEWIESDVSGEDGAGEKIDESIRTMLINAFLEDIYSDFAKYNNSEPELEEMRKKVKELAKNGTALEKLFNDETYKKMRDKTTETTIKF